MSQAAVGVPYDAFDNPLLMKTELGKPAKRGFTLPDYNFTYGRPNLAKDGGAAEAMSGWSPTASLPTLRKEKRPDRDFVALNKACIGSGLVTAKEQFEYRATHDVRRRVAEEEKNKTKIKRIPASMTFGISTRPSTPVFDLLEHRYQDRWLNERRKNELAKRDRLVQKQNLNKGIYETRASLLRKYCPPVESPPLWQMPKFQKQQPHLETFRSTQARQKAFESHATDCTARTGVFGHGTYESAKS
ncbi:cilia- and flagella-associated protein 77-like [Patiria miniata]|uniref:Cilia- and flagella-associated protein 77 n=1 Tax=Patiria miniata TaxID=46514 RepID=A0A913Z3G8_PATMI|nr:cilia- and flagella-associated protein 77-like [Patiria miniata]